jgi:hypothetical protein
MKSYRTWQLLFVFNAAEVPDKPGVTPLSESSHKTHLDFWD